MGISSVSLHNKWPQNSWLKTQRACITRSFCGLGTWEQLDWTLPLTVPPEAAVSLGGRDLIVPGPAWAGGSPQVARSQGRKLALGLAGVLSPLSQDCLRVLPTRALASLSE